jgi:phage terminase large subunit-like protein
MQDSLKKRYETYREGVIDGKIVVSRAVAMAVARSYADDTRDDIKFDIKRAERVVKFIETYLQHFEGDYAGQPFILQPWQVFIVCQLYGRLKGGIRKYTQAYIQTGRKNGKSSFLAALGAYSLLGAQEPAAQVYSVATTRDQAAITRDQARIMIAKSPELKKYIKELNKNIFVPKTNSKFIALSSDANVLDGLSPSFTIIDELAAHPSDEVWSVMVSAVGSRREPLTVAITTPLFLREQSVALDRYHYGKQILDGTLDNDHFFPFICELDEEDDWLSALCWAKANPSLGVCCYLKTLQDACEQARIIPASEVMFKMRHLSTWQEGTSSWLNISDYDACAAPDKTTLDHLNGRQCWGGLDLADTDDLAAFVLLFPPDESNEFYEILPFFWCPEAQVEERQKRGRIPYHHWVKAGHMTATPGNQIEYEAIEAKIIELAGKYQIKMIGHDPFNATASAQRLTSAGLLMVPIRQTPAELGEATKEARRLILTRRLRHYSNPVMRWCVGNVMVAIDANLNEKILKHKSVDKVDGAAALIDAMTAFIREEIEEEEPCVYDERGILFI